MDNEMRKPEGCGPMGKPEGREEGRPPMQGPGPRGPQGGPPMGGPSPEFIEQRKKERQELLDRIDSLEKKIAELEAKLAEK